MVLLYGLASNAGRVRGDKENGRSFIGSPVFLWADIGKHGAQRKAY